MASIPGWLIECWALCGLAIFIILLRLALRTDLRGWKGWQGDDYFSVIALITFTYVTTGFHLMQRYGVNIGLTDEGIANMTPKEISDVRIGSIIDFFCWFSGTTLLWSCKGCMLFLYARVTSGLQQMKMVKMTVGLLVITYTACILANIFKCGLPIRRNWQVEPNPGVCTAGALNMYVAGISNCVTDIVILTIMAPLLWKINMPLRKKIFSYLMLCSGIFIVIVSIMRSVYSIMSVYGKGKGTNVGFALAWSAREAITAVAIVNIPIILTSIRRLSRVPGSWVSTLGTATGRSTSNDSNHPQSQIDQLRVFGSFGGKNGESIASHVRPSTSDRRRTETDTYIIYGEDDDDESIRASPASKEKFSGSLTEKDEAVQVRSVNTGESLEV